MTAPAWESRKAGRWTSVLIYRSDPVGELDWVVQLEGNRLATANDRVLAGLNRLDRLDLVAKPWSWEPLPGTNEVRLLHNGREMGAIRWAPKVRKGYLTDHVVASLNEALGRATTRPEPARPANPAAQHVLPRPEYVTADHDFVTGEDLISWPVAS